MDSGSGYVIRFRLEPLTLQQSVVDTTFVEVDANLDATVRSCVSETVPCRDEVDAPDVR
jgi:hypothetical protein